MKFGLFPFVYTDKILKYQLCTVFQLTLNNENPKNWKSPIYSFKIGIVYKTTVIPKSIEFPVLLLLIYLIQEMKKKA